MKKNITNSATPKKKSRKCKSCCIILATLISAIAIIKLIIRFLEKKKVESELKEIVAFFSTKVFALAEKISSGVMLSSYFSVLTADFSNCEFEDNTFVSVKSICGVITIVVPRNVNVKFDYINNFSFIKNDAEDVDITDAEENEAVSGPTLYIAMKSFGSVVRLIRKDA